MWLAEIIGRMKGEDVKLRNNPLTEWVCDPHTKVSYILYVIILLIELSAFRYLFSLTCMIVEFICSCT